MGATKSCQYVLTYYLFSNFFDFLKKSSNTTSLHYHLKYETKDIRAQKSHQTRNALEQLRLSIFGKY